ncbi:tyrosine-type recombinase/integrase, partial [Thermodesulfobacteriota bacterium]
RTAPYVLFDASNISLIHTKDGITARHAKEALKSRMGDIAKGKFNLSQTKTYPLFNGIVDKYLEWSETHKRSAERDLTSSKHIKPFFRHKRINEVAPLMIERYIRNRKNVIRAMKKNKGKLDRDISFCSINRELAMMKHLFSKAGEWGLYDKNPVKGIKMFPEKKRSRYLREEEISSLIEACDRSKNKSLKAIVVTAITTGARLNEILGLRVIDLDFRNYKINLEHTKTGGRESVTMSECLKEVLTEHLSNKNNKESEYLFCNDDGTRFKDIRTAFKTALKDASITGFRFHDLRHTFASHLAMNGVEGRTLQELGRWKTPTMVMRYAHLSAEHKKKAVDTLSNLFENKLDLSNILVKADFEKEEGNG